MCHHGNNHIHGSLMICVRVFLPQLDSALHGGMTYCLFTNDFEWMSLDICKIGKWGHTEYRRLLNHAYDANERTRLEELTWVGCCVPGSPLLWQNIRTSQLEGGKSILAHSLGDLSPRSADSTVLRSVATRDNVSPHGTQEGERDRHKEVNVLHPT